MKACVLASGSEGNVTYVETEHHKILLDIGMTVKYITEKLSELSISPEEIDYVFITHVHDDHVKALKQFIKKYSPTICVSPQIFAELEVLKDYDKILLYEDLVCLRDVKIDIIKTSHDTTDSRGFVLESKGKSVVYLTDTGFINQKNFNKIKNKNIYLFESNHDIPTLMATKRPQFLKARIISNYGHLCHEEAAQILNIVETETSFTAPDVVIIPSV